MILLQAFIQKFRANAGYTKLADILAQRGKIGCTYCKCKGHTLSDCGSWRRLSRKSRKLLPEEFALFKRWQTRWKQSRALANSDAYASAIYKLRQDKKELKERERLLRKMRDGAYPHEDPNN